MIVSPASIRHIGDLQTEMLSWGDKYRVKGVVKISFILQFWDLFFFYKYKENIIILLDLTKDFMYPVRKTNRMPPRAEGHRVAFLRDSSHSAALEDDSSSPARLVLSKSWVTCSSF